MKELTDADCKEIVSLLVELRDRHVLGEGSWSVRQLHNVATRIEAEIGKIASDEVLASFPKLVRVCLWCESEISYDKISSAKFCGDQCRYDFNNARKKVDKAAREMVIDSTKFVCDIEGSTH